MGNPQPGGAEVASKRKISATRQEQQPTDRNSPASVSKGDPTSIDRVPVESTALRTDQETPVVAMARAAYVDILQHIASRPAESGGILLGPIGSNEVTHFHFDYAGSCTSSSYSPDHVGLGRRMKQKWLPSGLDMKGFAHSHPGRLDWLTDGDLRYIRRLMLANEDMEVFVAPVVIPIEFRMRPIVVLRADMCTPRQARLALY